MSWFEIVELVVIAVVIVGAGFVLVAELSVFATAAVRGEAHTDAARGSGTLIAASAAALLGSARRATTVLREREEDRELADRVSLTDFGDSTGPLACGSSRCHPVPFT